MANNVGPTGTVRVKIKDGDDYWIVENNNTLQLSTVERSAKLLTQTGDDQNFTLSYTDENDRTWYVAKSGSTVIFATSSISWEVSGTKLQVLGNANEQTKRASTGGLELASPGHDVELDLQPRSD